MNRRSFLGTIVSLVMRWIAKVDDPVTAATATLTGGLITDATRTAAADGDGLTVPDSSVGIYEAATNLVANPNAVTNTTGWLGVFATMARDTSVAKFGTTSFKITATSAASFWMLGTSVITGSPLSQARTLYSAWVLPSAGLVGKTVRLQINEIGGAQPLAFYFHDEVLTSGWQIIRLLIPALAQPDRTSLNAYVMMLDTAQIGDTLNVGGIMLNRTTSVVTPYTASSRSVGRIQVPVTRLSTRQGWVAFRIRPDWGDGVPDNPVYLWTWRDDDTHRLDLRWESGRFLMRRSSPLGTEEASIIGVAGLGEEVTIIGRWSAAGVSLSKRGQPFRAADTVDLDDDFARPDHAGWGTAPTGGAWTLVGAGASGASIVSGRATAPDLTVYGFFRPMQPMARMWARMVFQAGVAYDEGVIALLVSASPTTPLEEMIHWVPQPTKWSFQVTETTVPNLVTILESGYKTPLVFDGVTAYDFAVHFDGEVAYIEIPDGTRRTIRDSRIADLNQGSYTTFELWQNVSGPNATLTPMFEAVQAELPIGATDTTGGYVPTIAATMADLGSKDGTTGFLNGDILWYAAGNRAIGASDAARIAALPLTPRRNDFPANAGVRWLWGADDSTINSYRPVTLLGNSPVVPAYHRDGGTPPWPIR